MTIVCHQITCMQAGSRHNTKFKNLCNLFISLLQLSDVERHGNLSFVYKVRLDDSAVTYTVYSIKIYPSYIIINHLQKLHKTYINHLQSFLCCIQTQPGALRIQSFSVWNKSFLKRIKDFFLFSIKYFISLLLIMKFITSSGII